VGGLQDNGSVLYKGNSSWTQFGIAGDGSGSVIDWTNPNIMYTTVNYTSPAQDRIEKSTDGGANWLRVGFGLDTGYQTSNPLALDRANSNHLVFGTNIVYETLNGAATPSTPG